MTPLDAASLRAQPEPLVTPDGYKQTEVGIIPEDWQIGPVSAFCDQVVDCKNRTPPVVEGGEFAVVRTPNVRGGKFVRDELRFTDEVSYTEWTRRAVPRFGDVLITREAPLGEVCLCPSDLKVCLGQRMMLYRPNTERLVSSFLLFALMSTGVQLALQKQIGGSTVGHARVDDIKKLLIPLPPTLAEQEAIAEALSDADALVEGLECLIAKKRAIKQGAMQELLTGQRRLPGFEGEWIETELGRIPTDWTVTSIGAVADVKTGPFGSSLHERDYVHEGTPIVTVEHLGERGIIHSNLPLVSDADCRRLSAYSLQDGDIVFSRVGSVDRNALVRGSEEGWLFSGRLLRLRTLPAIADARFLSFHFHGEPFKQRVRTVAVGQTMSSLNTKLLSGVLILLPTLIEQVAIASILTEMDDEISALETKLAKARKVKQGMMQELLTGRIRSV